MNVMAASNAPFEETARKYPDVPRFIILKLDLYRRGIVLADSILESIGKTIPPPVLMRDGSMVFSILGGMAAAEKYLLAPYRLDLRDGKTSLLYEETFIDEVEFSPAPAFYGKKTSRGTPMTEVAFARPQRLDIWCHRTCAFWQGGNQCKFCAVNTIFRDRVAASGEMSLDPQDIKETVHEAIQETGRFSQVTLTGGADPGEDKTFDAETERYITLLQAIGENFSGKRFPSQLLSCGLSKKQLKRIHSQTGLLSYCPDIEVWDKERFAWICPGKEKFIGWDAYVKSMLDAVEIFGQGRVYTNIVAGCEMARPHGFKTEDEALKSNLEGCEYLAKHGVAMMSLVWRPAWESAFRRQQQPSLDYYVRLNKGLHDIRATYGLEVHSDDYKHCGNHADSDLCRID
jgi:hypothetical protein